MPKADRDAGDVQLQRIFAAFNAQLVSPGGAAALLGISRKTVHTLCKRGRLRAFVGPEVTYARGLVSEGPRWVFIPIVDVARYAEEVGRPFPKAEWADSDDVGTPFPGVEWTEP
jgi:hypothetical protein